ncbi:MAG: CPBP family intramembrane glutamic endopeptidase, partial [Verrucomicrobiota bacterium]
LGEEAEEAGQLTAGKTWIGIMMNLMLLGALFFFVGYMGRRSISEVFGLARYPWWRVLVVSTGLMFVVVPLVFVASFVFRRTVLNDVGDGLEMQEAVKLLAEQSDFALRFSLILAACVVAPVVEEFIFRGYFYPVVKRYSDRFFSAVVTSLAFAVVHMNLLSMAPLFVLAMAFTIAYELTGCLWVPIVMHALFNAAQVAMILFFMAGA